MPNQVTQQMGPPEEVKQRSDGGEEWRYRDYQPTYPYQRPGPLYRVHFAFRFKQSPQRLEKERLWVTKRGLA